MDKQQKIESIMTLLNGMPPREAKNILDECKCAVDHCTVIDMTGIEMPCLDGVHPDAVGRMLYGIITNTKIVYKKGIAQ